MQFITFYRTDAMHETRHFYEDVLALNVYKDQGACVIYKVTEHSGIGFCTHHPKAPSSGACLTFVFDTTHEVDAWRQRIMERGLEPSEAVANETFKIYHFFVRDPNNYLVEFQVFL